jgi:Ribonuclease G/E
MNKALKSKVWLKSGGYIVINQTEALVAIDINPNMLDRRQTEAMRLLSQTTFRPHPVAWVYECRAAHTAGVRSGRHRIGRSPNPGRTAAKYRQATLKR